MSFASMTACPPWFVFFPVPTGSPDNLDVVLSDSLKYSGWNKSNWRQIKHDHIINYVNGNSKYNNKHLNKPINKKYDKSSL